MLHRVDVLSRVVTSYSLCSVTTQTISWCKSLCLAFQELLGYRWSYWWRTGICVCLWGEPSTWWCSSPCSSGSSCSSPTCSTTSTRTRSTPVGTWSTSSLCRAARCRGHMRPGGGHLYSYWGDWCQELDHGMVAMSCNGPGILWFAVSFDTLCPPLQGSLKFFMSL